MVIDVLKYSWYSANASRNTGREEGRTDTRQADTVTHMLFSQAFISLHNFERVEVLYCCTILRYVTRYHISLTDIQS